MADFKKLVKGMGLTTGNILAPHLDWFLDKHNEFAPTITIGGVKIDDGHFHPSGHCLMDEEALYQDRHPHSQYEERNTAKQKKTFDIGHFWHGYLQAALVEMGFVEAGNVERKFLWEFPGRPKDGIMASGTIDLLDVEIPGRGTWLVDIKSTAASTFNSIESLPLYQKYLAQVNVYADMAERKNMMILVVSKESGEFREIQVQRDPILLAEIYGKWARVAERLLA